MARVQQQCLPDAADAAGTATMAVEKCCLTNLSHQNRVGCIILWYSVLGSVVLLLHLKGCTGCCSRPFHPLPVMPQGRANAELLLQQLHQLLSSKAVIQWHFQLHLTLTWDHHSHLQA